MEGNSVFYVWKSEQKKIKLFFFFEASLIFLGQGKISLLSHTHVYALYGFIVIAKISDSLAKIFSDFFHTNLLYNLVPDLWNDYLCIEEYCS